MKLFLNISESSTVPFIMEPEAIRLFFTWSPSIDLGRRQIIRLSIYHRIRLMKKGSHLTLQEVHVCSEIIIQGSDIAPVGIQPVAVYRLDIPVSYKNIAYKIMPVLLGAFFYKLYEMTSALRYRCRRIRYWKP